MTIKERLKQIYRLAGTPFTIFWVAFLVYIANLRPIASGDTLPASLLPFSLIYEHNIYFDQFIKYFSKPNAVVYYFTFTHGHWLSSYPISLPVLLSPFYWVALKIMNFSPTSIAKTVQLASVMEKYAASAIAALSVTFMYLLLKKLSTQRIAIILTLVYAFATNTWSTSSQALWQQGFSELTIILTLYTFSFLKNKPSLFIFTGLFASLAVVERFNNIFFAIVITIFLFFRYRRYFLFYLCFPITLGGLFISYNLYFFNSLIGGYSGSQLATNPIFGFINILINPNRGLFVFFPAAIFSFIGLFLTIKKYKSKQEKPIYLISSITLIIGISSLSLWPQWWGGSVFGPRLLVDIIPFLIILIVPVAEKIKSSNLVKILFGISVAFSVLVQFLGAFYFIGSDGDNFNPKLFSLFYWKNSQLVKTVKMGIYAQPFIEVGNRFNLVKPTPVLTAEAYKVKLKILRSNKNLKRGELTNYLIRAKNVSGYKWPKGYKSPTTRSISLASHWLDKNTKKIVVEGIRNYIPKDINPGQSIEIDALIEAPWTPGQYILELGMLQEGVGWFHETNRFLVTIQR